MFSLINPAYVEVSKQKGFFSVIKNISARLATVGVITAVLLTACGGSGESPLNELDPIVKSQAPQWLSAWGGTRTTGTAPVNATIRNIARVTAGGSEIRLRFFNKGTTPMVIGNAYAGIRDGATGAALVSGSNIQVTFNGGQKTITILPDTASVYSDPVALLVKAQDDVAVSLFIPNDTSPGEFSTEWNTSYVTAAAAGDLSSNESAAAYTVTSDTLYALRDIEVLTTEATGAIVFLGSSSFHGSNSTRDANKRVSDQISARINNEIPAGEQKTVVNRGIGGDSLGAAFPARMEQDVWSTTGVDTVVVWVTNDLGIVGGNKTADQIIVDYLALIAQAHTRGINVICPTWVPGAQSAPGNLNGEREKLNDWILNSKNCDLVVDYNKVVQNETVPTTWKPEYLSDHIHANDAGHTAWADMTPVLEWVSHPKPAP
jgi:lysophospholipase L1-like esterase